MNQNLSGQRAKQKSARPAIVTLWFLQYCFAGVQIPNPKSLGLSMHGLWSPIFFSNFLLRIWQRVHHSYPGVGRDSLYGRTVLGFEDIMRHSIVDARGIRSPMIVPALIMFRKSIVLCKKCQRYPLREQQKMIRRTTYHKLRAGSVADWSSFEE